MHIAMALFLALYAAGAVAHSVSGSAMTIEMLTASETGMDMRDCQDCDLGGDAAAAGMICDMVCTTPLAATTAESPGPILLAPLPLQRRHSEILAIGRNGSPEPAPPRTLI